MKERREALAGGQVQADVGLRRQDELDRVRRALNNDSRSKTASQVFEN
ncbi:MAG: hypothetical protein WAM39_19205 [Bryobacteraceae bacterium]